jgi:hypothetical protein
MNLQSERELEATREKHQLKEEIVRYESRAIAPARK